MLALNNENPKESKNTGATSQTLESEPHSPFGLVILSSTRRRRKKESCLLGRNASERSSRISGINYTPDTDVHAAYTSISPDG